MSAPGHNSSFSNVLLRSLVERIERLEEEKRILSCDIREIYAEAKAGGFDTGIVRRIIVMRRKEEAERNEERALLDLYLSALGMLAGTPLGTWAMERRDEPETAEEAGERLGRAGLPPDQEIARRENGDAEAHMRGWHRGNRERLHEEAAA